MVGMKDLFLLACALCSVVADVPVHCTQWNILGEWKIHVGKYKKGTGFDSQCGYNAPDDAGNHHFLTPPRRADSGIKFQDEDWLTNDFQENFAMRVQFKDWAARVISVEGDDGGLFPTKQGPYVGHWTMIYDEGFNFQLQGEGVGPVHSLFAFNKYKLKPRDDPNGIETLYNQAHSFCNFTLLGWYSVLAPPPKDALQPQSVQQRLCYWGERVMPLHEEILALEQKAGSYLQLRQNRTGRTLRDYFNDVRARQQKARTNGHKVRWYLDETQFTKWVRSLSLSKDMEPLSQAESELDRFSPVLRRLPGFNSWRDKSPHSETKGPEEMVSLAQQLGKPLDKLEPADLRALRGEPGPLNHHLDSSFEMGGETLGHDGWKTLTTFDWRKVSRSDSPAEGAMGFAPPVPDQGQCGSCFAWASTSMFTARLMLRYPDLWRTWKQKPDRISTNQQVSCNYYNQGCMGGYPYLVSRWSMENDLKLESCGGSCDASSCSQQFRVASMRYVGGAFGRCDGHKLCEPAIREELYSAGPVVSTMGVNDDFFAYAGGIYEDHSAMLTQNAPANDQDCKDTECYTFKKVDHAVLLVGWGEQAPSKDEPKPYPYWLIQNSWNETWGEKGYMRLGERGKNPMDVEALTLVADLVRLEKQKNNPGFANRSTFLQRHGAPLAASHH